MPGLAIGLGGDERRGYLRGVFRAGFVRDEDGLGQRLQGIERKVHGRMMPVTLAMRLVRGPGDPEWWGPWQATNGNGPQRKLCEKLARRAIR